MKNPGVTLTVERLKQIEAGSGPSIQEAGIMARVCLFHHPDMFMDGIEATKPKENKCDSAKT